MIECQSHWRKNFLPYVCYVATIPYESLRHKSNTFHTILAICTSTSIDKTNKTQQKVRGSKFMFKMSTTHANTCIQTTMPLRSRCRVDGVHGPAASTPSADVLSTLNVLSTHIMDPPAVDSLSRSIPRCCSPPDSNLANCHISGGINSGVSLCSMVTVSRARCAGAPSC